MSNGYIIISLLYCFSNESKEEIEKQANNTLEHCIEHAGISLVEIGVGVYQIAQGQILSGAIEIGAGIHTAKQAIEEFNEAKDLFSKSREMENPLDNSQDKESYPDREYR